MAKQCLKCKFVKESDQFEKHCQTKDGLQTRCKICRREDKALSYLKNKTATNARTKLYYETNKSKVLSKKQEYYKKNAEKMNEWQLQYARNNKGLYKAIKAKYRAAKLKATPKWANLEKIQEIYKNCPIGYHVDHIIPLQGENICGLHIETNLQYLPASENCRKGNKYG